VAVSELARLHAAWWASSRLDALDWMPALGDHAATAGLPGAIARAAPRFIEQYGAGRPPALIKTVEQLAGNFRAIEGRCAAGPWTLCHGDYRLDNLFFDLPDAPLAAVDWQLVVRAPGVRDLGYFLCMSLDVETRRAHEIELIQLYQRALKEHGIDAPSFEDCLTGYRWTLLYCLYMPVMAVHAVDFGNDRGEALLTAMCERGIAANLDWNTGALLDA
jgi:hypothetical protein